MAGIAFEVVVILLLLVLNGIFSMSEMAVVTARKVRLEHRAEEGDKGAQAALDIAMHPNNFMSTVQVGITLIGVLAGAFGGVGISESLAQSLSSVSWMAPYATPIAFFLVVSVITYLSLIIGELVPKQIALGHPEKIASLVARPMQVVSRIGSPLVFFLTGSTNLVFRVVGMKPIADRGATEQDIRAMVEQAAESGAVQPGEHLIVENTFRLGDRQVAAIMTPRVDVTWIDVGASVSELREELTDKSRDRGQPFLVCEEDLEHVLGVVYAEDLLVGTLDGMQPDLLGSLLQPLYVPDSLPVLKLLEAFRNTRHRAAVALDEFGGVAGVVTLDDILEALVGELPQFGSAVPSEITRQPDGTSLVRASTAVDDFEALFDIDRPSDAEKSGSTTVGGLVMALLEKLPQVGDFVRYGTVRMTVERMNGRRIDLLRVQTIPSSAEEDTALATAPHSRRKF